MGKFAKGQSGNPGGRPKLPEEIKEIARASSGDAFKRVVELMDSADDERVQLAAAKEVLDRAFGKPAQAMEVSGKEGGPLAAILQIVRKEKA